TRATEVETANSQFTLVWLSSSQICPTSAVAVDWLVTSAPQLLPVPGVVFQRAHAITVTPAPSPMPSCAPPMFTRPAVVPPETPPWRRGPGLVPWAGVAPAVVAPAPDVPL